MGIIRSLFDFSFSQFITTKVVKVLYVLGVIATGLMAIAGFFGVVVGAQGFVGTVGMLVVGVPLFALAFLVGTALLRIFYEMVIVLFRIAENVQTVARSAQQAPPEREPAHR
jgi:hypothetical protein